MRTAADIAPRLVKQSREQLWNVYEEFDWPEALSGERYCMAPHLCSIYGTELWDSLDEAQRLKVSFYEAANFFSLTLQGERPLVAGLSDRLYSKRMEDISTEYIHHFLDEENKHMVMFGMYLHRYVGKVYPEKKIAFGRDYKKGEEDVAFYCKALVVEEIGDYYNVEMMSDDTLEPIVRELNWVHHRDESRHIAFGRLKLAEVADKWLSTWDEETVTGFQAWLAQYLKSSWNDFYNPTMYKDAGLNEPYKVRKMALAHPKTAEFRKHASRKLVKFFLKTGLLAEEPAL